MGSRFRDIAFAMLVAGAVLRRPPATVFGAFLLGVAGLSWAFSRLALGEVTYGRKLSSNAAFSGDSIELTITIENKKPLPIPLVCDDEIPRALEPPVTSQQAGHRSPGKTWLRNEMSLGGFETVTRKFAIDCPDRGVYSLGPVTVSSGDPFGLYPVSSSIDTVERVTVYPRVVPVVHPPSKSMYPFGTARSPSWTYQDPSMLKMIREYVPGDSTRHLDWKATARTGRLQARQFDATFGNRVVMCLDLSTSRVPWEGADKEAFESLTVVAASLCSHFHAKGFAVGYTSNGVSHAFDDTRLGQCPPATGDAHLAYTLSSLAGLGYYTFGSAAAACARPWVRSAGSFPVVVTALADDTMLALLRDLRRNAPRIALIVLEQENRLARDREQVLCRASSMPGVQVIRGSLEGGWDRAESLTLSPME